MHLEQRLIIALALSRHVFASLLAAAPAQAVRRIPAPGQTSSPHLHNRGDLEERQEQVVLMGCPEMFNEPVHSCGSCGGESKSTPGKCNDPNGSGFFCKCSNTGPNGKTTTHVTTTVGSATAIGTYELDTMTDYASLRQHITVTTTVTASNTATGDSGLETVAAVVLAGGVAWFLADASGGAAAISQLEPPQDADDHEDDKDCPDPKDKCSDCGGKLQMCTTGTDSGCACEEEEDECPADGSNDQPNCSDDSCNAQNGKCTAGDHKGCDCKKTECPADGSDDQPNCSDDGCEPQDGKCTGGDYKDCDCKQTECPDLKEYPFFFCSDCGGDDGSGKCKGDPDEDPPNLWKSCECNAEPDWNSWPDDKLTRTNVAQHQAVLNSLPDISAAQPSSSSAPLPKPSCDSNDVSGIPYNVFDPGVFTKFCNTLNGGDKSKALKQTVDSSGNVISGSKMKRTPPPNPSAYKDYKFFLSWSGGDGSCSSGCTNVFSTITDNICGHVGGESNVMTNEAKLDTGCGIYSYSISAPPSATSTPGPTDPTEVPAVPTVGPIQCAKYEDAYKKCWHDIHASSVEDCKDAMANQLPGGKMTSASANITQFLREGASGGQGGNGVVYFMNIGWIPGCKDYDSQVIDNPLGHSGDDTISYGTLLMNTYNKCNNNGLGGFVDVGCVRYGFYPNDLGDSFGSPPHPELFWKQYPNICP